MFQLKHMLVNNELKVGVFALTSIKAGSEITLPFDFPYEQWSVDSVLHITSHHSIVIVFIQ